MNIIAQKILDLLCLITFCFFVYIGQNAGVLIASLVGSHDYIFFRLIGTMAALGLFELLSLVGRALCTISLVTMFRRTNREPKL